jgi:hypothetical protein
MLSNEQHCLKKQIGTRERVKKLQQEKKLKTFLQTAAYPFEFPPFELEKAEGLDNALSPSKGHTC